MDEEMEEELWRDDFPSSGFEIDLDYEYEAAKFFDLSRDESRAESAMAELWFESAGSNPPSPFVERLSMLISEEDFSNFPKFNDADFSEHGYAGSSICSGSEFPAHDKCCEALCDMVEDVPVKDIKSSKGSFSRGSTLMKPTASQLAKQNRLGEMKRIQFSQRYLRRSIQKCGRTTDILSINMGHASKRQKLEGGRSYKVRIKEQAEFLHKATKKKVVPADVGNQRSRLGITIPREPILETKQRAQRLRARRFGNGKESKEERSPTLPMFKARPLNRKIFEAPKLPLSQKSKSRLTQFQPFKLKTEERALHHSSGSSSTSQVAKDPTIVSTTQISASNSGKVQSESTCPSQLQIHEKKASTKREITKPKEFNFSLDRRCQQDPPTELFNKLSLNTETHQTSASRSKSLGPCHGGSKGCKENISCNVELGQKDIRLKKDEQVCGTAHVNSELSQHSNYRSHMNKQRLGIR